LNVRSRASVLPNAKSWDSFNVRGGEIHTNAVKQKLNKSPLIALKPANPSAWRLNRKNAGNPNYSGKPTLDDVAARLAQLGLAFGYGLVQSPYNTRQVIGFELAQYLAIPQEIRAFLPSFVETKQATPRASSQDRHAICSAISRAIGVLCGAKANST
jgi:hypothetical protein